MFHKRQAQALADGSSVIADKLRKSAFSVFVILTFCAVFALTAAVPRAHAATENFVLMADTHFGQPFQTSYEDAETTLLWAGELNNLKAVCVAGDVTDRGDAASFSEWEYLCDSIVPFAARIQALGDHDTGKNGIYLGANRSLTVANGFRNFKQINGGATTSYTEFEHVNIMTLGGISAKGHSVISKSMIKQLNNRLRTTMRQGKVAIVVCHYPYSSGVLNMHSKLMGVLRSYPNVVFVSGHMHTYSAKAQCQMVKPSCKTTPYGRTGFKKKTKYAFRSIGVNACSRYRSGKYSFADSLRITDRGVMTLRKWNITKDRVDKIWQFKQARSSITVRSVPTKADYPKPAEFTYQITFSDGGTYGGVASGSTFSLKAGTAKKFAGIPSGVLVTVKVVGVPSGWSKPKAQALEVTKSAQTMRFKSTYAWSAEPQSNAKLRAA